MTLEQVLDWADRMKPGNRFSNEDKTVWISELEGMARQALLQEGDNVYHWPEDRHCELIVQAPHDRVYRHYVLAQMSYANEEYDRYNNEYEMFNATWQEWLNWVCRVVRPAYREK